MPLTLKERIEGCLTGCAIGVELGWSRTVHGERFTTAGPDGIFNVPLEPVDKETKHPCMQNIVKTTPLVELGVRAYLDKKGRVTPEDFGRELRDDRRIAEGLYYWDLLHTTQELLKEGMHPRISGLGTAPHGLIAAAMPAVGIYHFADPEYAYLDGVELASVCQPRIGADWAALVAAAVAAAFTEDAEGVVETVKTLAFNNNKDVFYDINFFLRQQAALPDMESAKNLEQWRLMNSANNNRIINWIENNPLRYILPLLQSLEKDPKRMMALLLWPDSSESSVRVIVAGAIVGALHGPGIFPDAWRQWAGPIAQPWFAIESVVEKRRAEERTVIKVVEKLSTREQNGMTLLEDKIFGCLLASSIGNAMGSSTECMLAPDIDKKYPGGIKTVLDPKRLESEDDNQMAMFLVETYAEREGKPVVARHFGKTWYERLNRDHFYSLCMGNSYDLIRAGWDSRITGHWNVVTGSTVMCMEPVGIYHVADPEYAGIDAMEISYMYQRGLDVTVAAVLAATVAEALKPDATVEGVCKAALAAAPKDKLRTFDERRFASACDYLRACLEVAGRYDDVLAARKELYEKCLFYHAIDPLELTGLALAMFKISNGDVRQSAIGGTNIGRDADTIAGRAAMLSGALRGSAGVPEEWIQLFKPAGIERIKRNTKKMAECILKKQKALKKRQAR